MRSASKPREITERLCVFCWQPFLWGAKRVRICRQCAAHRKAIQNAAHKAVKNARASDRLPHPNSLKCVDCGLPADVYDHRDYSKPLDVEPVCYGCNIARGRAVVTTPIDWKSSFLYPPKEFRDDEIISELLNRRCGTEGLSVEQCRQLLQERANVAEVTNPGVPEVWGHFDPSGSSTTIPVPNPKSKGDGTQE